MSKLINSMPVIMKNVNLKEGFWNKYARLVREVVIPYQWGALNDAIPDAVPSHAIRNFKIAAGVEEGRFGGCVFQDSDVAKWLEAVGYSLEGNANDEFEKWADEVIGYIEKAQHEDGYLNTYFTIEKPGEQWTNLRECHELYCAGHMMEAAVAYYYATGKRTLLDVMSRFADHIDSIFGSEEGKLHGYDGHEEIELGLVKLYKATNNEKYLNLSKYFIDERGKEPYFLLEEWEKTGKVSFWNLADRNKPDLKYNQAHIPVREQTEAVGHAVRAVYLYSGMADIAALTGDDELKKACKTLWNNIVTKQMYITGGIGSTHMGEAFTFDYDLPNDTVYQETCASIGLVFFAHRMLQIEMDSSYGDVMEKALFNSIIGGMGLDGRSFLYVNPMEVWPEAGEKNPGRHHVKSVRQKWYGCACCPPNLARLLVSLQEYIYTFNSEVIYTHLYIPSEAEISLGGDKIKIEQETNYPWDGNVKLKIALDNEKTFKLALRIPGWCRKFDLFINGKPMEQTGNMESGYLYIDRLWKDNDEILIIMHMPVELMKSHPRVRANAGKVALQRGPLVYCLEEVDNGANLSAITICGEPAFSEDTDKALLENNVVITGKAVRVSEENWNNNLYQPYQQSEKEVDIKAVPYFLWGNRKPGEMLVWINHR